VLINNELKISWSAVPVPNTFRVNHSNRSASADPQTSHFSSKHSARYINEMALSKTFFQKFPTGLAGLEWRAFTVPDAQKNMPLSGG